MILYSSIFRRYGRKASSTARASSDDTGSGRLGSPGRRLAVPASLRGAPGTGGKAYSIDSLVSIIVQGAAAQSAASSAGGAAYTAIDLIVVRRLARSGSKFAVHAPAAMITASP